MELVYFSHGRSVSVLRIVKGADDETVPVDEIMQANHWDDALTTVCEDLQDDIDLQSVGVVKTMMGKSEGDEE